MKPAPGDDPEFYAQQVSVQSEHSESLIIQIVPGFKRLHGYRVTEINSLQRFQRGKLIVAAVCSLPEDIPRTA